MVSQTVTVEVAKNVAAYIARSNLSKNKVSTRSGIPQTTFSRKLNGHADFTISELGAIASVLGVHVSELIPASWLNKDAA